MGRLIALIAALVAGGLIAWGQERLPSPRPSTVPATEFSAARAMADVAVIGREPHPVGTPQDARARDHVVARMAELGLSPQVRPGVGLYRAKSTANVLAAGRAQNVIGVLPGRDRVAPAVALMAHYDSVPGSPGAADDAAGVAAALETVRAIKARGQPARDVMLVITDGEEAGLLGANAFFRGDPLARRIGLVLNMEARGGGGRAQMFQTSASNGALIDLFRRTAVRPSSSSLTVYIYQRLPNDTDLTEALRAGVPGLNYAFIGRQFDYHSPSSTSASLDQGSLQDLGQQVLATAAAAASAPSLPGKAPDMAYGQVLGDLVLAYPGWVGWLVLAAAAGLVALGVSRARRSEPFPWTDAARGAGALLFAVVGGVAVLQFARHATGAGVGYLEQRFLLAQVTRWETAVILLGLGFLLLAAAELARGRRVVAIVPLLAGLGCQAFGPLDPVGLGAGLAAAVLAIVALGRPVSRPGAWAGVLLVGLVLAVAVQALAPTAAFVVAWPLAMAALAAAATDCGARRGLAGQLLLGVICALALGWLGGLAHGAFISMDFAPLLAMPLLLTALVLWPLAQPADGAPPGRWLGAVLVLAGLAVTAWVRFADPWDARHPQATQIAYHVDLDARQAHIVSSTPDLPAWSQAALEANGGPMVQIRHWALSRAARAVPAAFIDTPPPVVSLARRGDGALVLRVAPAPGGGSVTAQLRPDAPLALESLGGVAVGQALAPGQWTTVLWAGSAEGADLVLRPRGPGGITVRAASSLPTWPAAARPLPARPPQVMAWGDSDGTIVTLTRRYAW